MTKGDITIVVASLVIVALLWAGFTFLPRANGELEAVVRIDDKVVARFIVTGDTISQAQIPVLNGTAIIEYGQGKTRVSPDSRHCPDGVCWRTGWLTKPGLSAVCIPNHMTLTLEGKMAEIDSIVR